MKFNRSSCAFVVTLLAAICATSCFAQDGSRIRTGIPINFQKLVLHLQGQPISVYEFVVSIYPMNTPPPWPVGLWIYEYVQVDQGSGRNRGQADWCRFWFSAVQTLEQENGTQVPYPFVETNEPQDPQYIMTDEGTLVLPPKSMTCWQVENEYAP
jgi:hypothetical protein